jgi:predicted transcriptional regulator
MQRLSVNINDDTAATLHQLAADRGVTVTEVVRRAVSVLKFVEDEVAAGSKLQVARGDRVTELQLL